MKTTKALLTLVAVIFAMGLHAQSGILTSASAAAQEEKDVSTVLVQAERAPASLQIAIDQSAELLDSYQMDISSWGFKSAELATKYFNAISDNLVHYLPDFENGTVTMQLQIANLGEKQWSVSDWNNYLSDRSTRYGKYLDGMNQ